MGRVRRAKGSKSLAISDITGFEVDYKDLVTTWDGLKVEREEYDPKHPQLTPAKNVSDAAVLRNARPDDDREPVFFYVCSTILFAQTAISFLLLAEVEKAQFDL